MGLNSTGLPELDAALQATEPGRETPHEAEAKESNAEGSKGKSSSASLPRRGSLESRLRNQIGIIGAGIDRIDRDEICGNAIMDGADDLASSLDAWARENPKVKEFLEGGIEGSAIIGVFVALVGILAPIAMQHAPSRRRARHRSAESVSPVEVEQRIVGDAWEAESSEELFENLEGYAGNGSPITKPNANDGGPKASDISGLPPIS